jgi:hypothetical protein
MLRMLSRSASAIVIVLAALGLGGCADSLTAGQPLQRFTDLMKPYDKTLTKEQQKAAIAEMQNAQVKPEDADSSQADNTSAVKPASTN